MKLKTSVAAVIFAFSAAGVWAGPTGTDQSKTDLGTPDVTADQPSSSAAANEDLQWKFVNGTGASDSDHSGTNQTAQPEQQGHSDHAAQSGEQESGAQSAMTEGQGESDQAAASEQEGGDQAAKSEEGDDSTDQTAKSEGENSDDQTARAEQEEGDQSANSHNPAADLKDKVVVIIPRDWKGSLPDLIAALESSPDAKDIVIVQQGEPQASNDEPGDEYEASNMKPIINQQ